MTASELDNPVWHSLSGPHRNLAGSSSQVRWYPRAMAPFVAIPGTAATATVGVLPALVATAEPALSDPAYFMGACPERPPADWEFVAESTVIQMVPGPSALKLAQLAEPEPPTPGETCRVLERADRPAMLELAHLAFPEYFRERTAELGVYMGIFHGADLVAMAGERLAFAGWQEISGVCTHPEFLGRGHASRLTRALLRTHRERGVASFLHVGEHNARARRLYESMGFAARASLPLTKMARLA